MSWPVSKTYKIVRFRKKRDKHLASRDRFWSLLQEKQVAAYLCGHTHPYSAVPTGGIWQIDAGHARGLGDLGAPGTFGLTKAAGLPVTFETYRDDWQGGMYPLRYQGVLDPLAEVFLPVVDQVTGGWGGSSLRG